MEGRNFAHIGTSMQHKGGQQDGMSCGLFVILAAMAIAIGGQQAEAVGASIVRAHAAQLSAACRYGWLCFIMFHYYCCCYFRSFVRCISCILLFVFYSMNITGAL